MAEGIITFLFTGLLIGCAFGADKYRQRSRKKAGIVESDDDDEGEDETDILNQKIAKTALRRQAKTRGESFVIDCAMGGPSSKKATPDEVEQIKENFKNTLKVDSLEGVDVGMLVEAL